MGHLCKVWTTYIPWSFAAKWL